MIIPHTILSTEHKWKNEFLCFKMSSFWVWTSEMIRFLMWSIQKNKMHSRKNLNHPLKLLNKRKKNETTETRSSKTFEGSGMSTLATRPEVRCNREKLKFHIFLLNKFSYFGSHCAHAESPDEALYARSIPQKDKVTRLLQNNAPIATLHSGTLQTMA